MDSGKYVRYTPEQVEALEGVYSECQKPSSLRRQQLVKECPLLANVEPKQIKVWFQNRRCREKQKNEASHLHTVNIKLTAMNKLLMEENDRLQKQISHLVYDNGYMRQQLQSASAMTTDSSGEPVAVSGQHQQQNQTSQHPERDGNSPAGLLAIAKQTLAEFLNKATGTAVDWVQMIGMKPGPDSIGTVAVSHNCGGVAARACGLVSLEPTKIAVILKDRPSWFRDCRCSSVVRVLPAGNGGTIELIYMQTYAPTTLATARDFWTLRYTTSLEDGSIVICERSLPSSTGGPAEPPATNFVRAEMLPSGFLVRPCEGGSSIIHIVDHIDLNVWSVPEVLRPLYESCKILAQKTTIAALRHIQQIARETSGEIQTIRGRQPAVLRTFSQKLCRGFNDAINGFADDGWSLLSSDGVEDVTIMINSSPGKTLGSQYNTSLFRSSRGVICAKASMLLQNVPPAMLVSFLREHRSEWADYGVDAYSAACLQASPYAIPCERTGSSSSSQVILPLAHTVEHEEFLEIVRLEGHSFTLGHASLMQDMYLIQLCSGVDENAVGASAQLVFAPINESFADDAPLLPSGFRIISLDAKADAPGATRTLDLASALEVGLSGAQPTGDAVANNHNLRSVLTIAFQFTFEDLFRDKVATMARQYVRCVVGSVQRVAMAIAPTPWHNSKMGPKGLPGSPEARTLARLICRSYRTHTGGDLINIDSNDGDALLKQLWRHSDAIMCCSLKTNASPVFTFANQAGFGMLETTLVSLQDITLDKILDEAGQKIICSQFSKMMQQGFAYLPAGMCVSSKGKPVSYEQAIAWNVVNDEDSDNCLALMFTNWCFY